MFLRFNIYKNMAKIFKTKNIESDKKEPSGDFTTNDEQKIQELGNLYNHDDLTHIKKPLGNTRVVMLSLIVAAFFGIFAGFIGLSLFLSGSFGNIPVIKNFSLDALLPTNSMIVEHKQQVVIKEEDRVGQVINEVSPMVVGIFKTKEKSDNILDDIYLEKDLIATGFIITEDGWVVSTSKSIDKNGNYTVVAYDQKIYTIDKIVIDPISQTAWLKFPGANLPVAKIANLDNLVQSQQLICLKNAVNNHSPYASLVKIEKTNWKDVTEGKDLLGTSDKFDKFIKLQDDLESGYQGAPLVNLASELVGISVIDQTGLVVVVPVDYIENIIPQVLKSGLIVRPKLGLEYLDLSQSVGAQVELVVGENSRQSITKGALVTSLTKHGPADKAEIKTNDIITKVDSQELSSSYNLTEAILSRKVGDQVNLTIWRSDQKGPLEIKVVLE